MKRNEQGKFAVRARDSSRASRLVDSQAEAERLVRQFNPEDRPDVERVRMVRTGGRDRWRAA